MSSEGPLIVPYGIADWVPSAGNNDPAAAPTVEIDRLRARPLRLNNMGWKFPTPPDLLRVASTGERLDFLREHLKSLCGLWDRLPRLFLDHYFRAIEATIEAHKAALVEALGPSGGLFDVRDWSFSAFCPLPQAHLPLAHLPLSERAAGAGTRVDFAFWTGQALIAVELVGATTHGRARRAGLERLRQSGVAAIEISSQALDGGDMKDIERALGPLLDGFGAASDSPRARSGPRPSRRSWARAKPRSKASAS
jgi:hypothetical protein